ncbi:hypothetical protein [Succinivibrio sp.]|uniref:hypothetical protein n=1 Tax=Succinivibrio sp. TaxID=2053619 RepID=UPI003869BF55
MINPYTYEQFLRKVREYAPCEFCGCDNPLECIEEAIRDNQEWLKAVYEDIHRRYPDEPKLTRALFKHVCRDTAGLLRWMW